MTLKLNRREQLSVFEKQGDNLFDGLDQLVAAGNIYQHQADAVQAIREDLLERKYNKQPGNVDYSNISLVVLPTGTGKTGVGVMAAYACKAKRVLLVTPSETISKQQLAQFMPVLHDQNINPLHNKPFLVERNIFDIDLTAHNEYEHWLPASLCVLKTNELNNIQRCELVITNAHKFGDGTGKGVNINIFPSDYFSLVIVDEAHHFPAKTWKNIIDHFRGGELILFLTATPYNKGKYILQKKPCFELSHEEAVSRGIIRETHFFEVEGNDVTVGGEEVEGNDVTMGEVEGNEVTVGCEVEGNEVTMGDEVEGNDITVDGEEVKGNDVILGVLQKVKETLMTHDSLDSQCAHKAMVLATKKAHAGKICSLWDNHLDFGQCLSFVQNDAFANVERFMKEDGVRVLVVIFRLTEGFDYKAVSVAAILRNVNKRSRVYFSQFVGRAVRKLHANDPVSAVVISHAKYKQRQNFEDFKNAKIAADNEEDPELGNSDIEDESD